MGASEDIQNKILSYLTNSNHGAHAIQIAEAIGHNRITVGKYLDVLKASGKVQVRSVGQANLWSLSKSAPGFKVLVVDDEQPIVNLIALTLGDSYSITTANDGQQALAQVASHMPDLIILDVMMPKKNGLEVCTLLKNNILTRNIYIIMLSAKSQTTDKIQSMQAGADYYLTKPFDPEELAALVRTKLCKRLTDQEKHPITGLDRGGVVRAQLASARKNKDRSCIIITIEGFQEFVEKAGFKHGLHILQFVAKICDSVIKQQGAINDYIGHLDDEQLLILTAADQKTVERRITEEFTNALPFLAANIPSSTPVSLSLSYRECD